MRPACVSILVLACSFTTGCFSARSSAPDSFLCQADRNLIEAPIRDRDEVKFIEATRKLAEKYWKQSGAACEHPSSHAYHDGFVEGFVDYIQSGGTGEPPYLPPFRYRLTQDRSPEGVAKIEDWYAGFRQGAAVARASGLREYSLIPLPSYAAPKDLNAVEPVEAKSPASTRNANEGSPWEKPGSQPNALPQPQPLPPAKDFDPNQPPARPIPIVPGAPNLSQNPSLQPSSSQASLRAFSPSPASGRSSGSAPSLIVPFQGWSQPPTPLSQVPPVPTVLQAERSPPVQPSQTVQPSVMEIRGDSSPTLKSPAAPVLPIQKPSASERGDWHLPAATGSEAGSESN